VIAKFMKHRAPLWFHLHRIFQVLGLAVAITGWLIALLKFEPVLDYTFATDTKMYHSVVGMTVMCLGLCQPLNAFVRPHKGESNRRMWEVVHKGGGWITICAGAATIALGINLLSEQEPIAFPHAKRDLFLSWGLEIGAVLLLAPLALLCVPSNRAADPRSPTFQMAEISPRGKGELSPHVEAL